jgi:anti-sigma regulatory factor (Ser/Thr protein kinase)
VQEEKKLKLPSRLESVEQAAQEIDAFARLIGFGDEAIFAIDMAARESVANAVKHGNLLDETKSVEITLSNMPDGFEIVIRDFGAGFRGRRNRRPDRTGKSFKSVGTRHFVYAHFYG